MNNSVLSHTTTSTPSEVQKSSVSTNKMTILTAEVNSLYKENMKNMENRNTTAIGEKKYTFNAQNDYNETKFQSFGKNISRDNGVDETKSRFNNDSFEKNNLYKSDKIINSNATKLITKQNQESRQNGYDLSESINTEPKSSKAFSASDNVAALLGKSNTTKNYEPNSLMQPKRIDAKITKSNSAIKSNGIKEHTVSSGATVIRTRREAMRQAEEVEAAKNRQHSSSNEHDNNREINSATKKNEKQDRITQEEDCGRLI